MSLHEARKYIKICLAIGVLAGIIGLLSFDMISTEVVMVLTLLSIGMLVVCVFLLFKYCKCPHCGEQLLRKAITIQKCPYCGKSLIKEDIEREMAQKRRKAAEKARIASEKARAARMKKKNEDN
ncbi:MAG: hypothetical protein AB7C97_04230 [Oscillospiraceae bacterium]